MPLPRTPCSLCEQPIIWVERLSDHKRIPIDPDPNYERGTLAAVNPTLVGGKRNVVEMVPEEERWMRSHLYVSHYTSCVEMQRCKRLGIYSFSECAALPETEPAQPGMTQSIREEINPHEYMLQRDR